MLALQLFTIINLMVFYIFLISRKVEYNILLNTVKGEYKFCEREGEEILFTSGKLVFHII